jgi:hypothetical protein
MCTELIDELQKLVDIYARMHQVSSGNPVLDEGVNEMADIVVSDLRSLIRDFKEHRMGPPNVPVGFRLHAVTH